jgi:CubicO group peptidase (beta-lactamase class C family)
VTGAVLHLLLLAGPAQSATPIDSVARYVEAEMARQRIPGLSIAVLRGDSVLLARGFGYANVEHRVAATDSTVYQSGSIGKQFTAAAMVMLADEGKLRLDDSVTRYLPEGARAWSGITLRHLLTHTSGIPDYVDSTLDYRRAYSEEELVRLAAALPLEFRPGERWSYSNTGYVLLGTVIRRVTGAFYGNFLQRRIFRPAGMRATRVISESDIVPHRAAGYRLVNDRLQNQEWVSPELNTTADGSLYLTVRDLAAWAVALNHGRVPPRSVLDRSWTPVRLTGGGIYPYGFGWSVGEQRGRKRIGHTGSWQGFKGSLQRYPEFGLTVIVLCNLAEGLPEAISYAVAGIVEPALAAPHLLGAALGGNAPPRPIPELLRRVESGTAGRDATPGLRGFASDEFRREVGEELEGGRAWTFLGCDDVRGRDVSRLGARVERVCYARGIRAGAPGVLAAALYAEGWQAADLEFYRF